MEEHIHSEATLLQSCKLGELQVDTADSAPLLCHSLINLTETTGHQNPWPSKMQNISPLRLRPPGSTNFFDQIWAPVLTSLTETERERP